MKVVELKLPLYREGNMCDSTACDPDFKGNHTYKILWVRKNGELLAECTGCGIRWQGIYKKHWLPERVGLALMNHYPALQMKRSLDGGYIYASGTHSAENLNKRES